MKLFKKGETYQLAHATWDRPNILHIRPYMRGGPTGMVYQLFDVYEWNDPVLGKIQVNRGFLTDGASIPKFAWGIVGHPFSGFLEAAVVHDMLYGVKCIIVDGEEIPITRKEADQVFHRILIDLGCSRVKASTMYRSLRLFGNKAWKNKESYTDMYAPLMVNIEQ